MKYGLFYFSDEAKKRVAPPDMKKLPEKCCKNCFHWCDIEQGDLYGPCGKHSDSEWGAFSWADDCCAMFESYSDE